MELPVQTEQKLTENDFKVMKSLVGIQTGERQGSGVIYDEEENRILIATAGHVLADDTGEARVTFPDGTQVAATGVETVDSCDLAFLWVDKGRNCQRKHGRSVCRCRRIGSIRCTGRNMTMYGCTEGEWAAGLCFRGGSLDLCGGF